MTFDDLPAELINEITAFLGLDGKLFLAAKRFYNNITKKFFTTTIFTELFSRVLFHFAISKPHKFTKWYETFKHTEYAEKITNVENYADACKYLMYALYLGYAKKYDGYDFYLCEGENGMNKLLKDVKNKQNYFAYIMEVNTEKDPETILLYFYNNNKKISVNVDLNKYNKFIKNKLFAESGGKSEGKLGKKAYRHKKLTDERKLFGVDRFLPLLFRLRIDDTLLKAAITKVLLNSETDITKYLLPLIFDESAHKFKFYLYKELFRQYYAEIDLNSTFFTTLEKECRDNIKLLYTANKDKMSFCGMTAHDVFQFIQFALCCEGRDIVDYRSGGDRINIFCIMAPSKFNFFGRNYFDDMEKVFLESVQENEKEKAEIIINSLRVTLSPWEYEEKLGTIKGLGPFWEQSTGKFPADKIKKWNDVNYYDYNVPINCSSALHLGCGAYNRIATINSPSILRHIDFSKVKMNRLCFENISFEYVNFRGSRFDEVFFYGCTFENVFFDKYTTIIYWKTLSSFIMEFIMERKEEKQQPDLPKDFKDKRKIREWQKEIGKINQQDEQEQQKKFLEVVSQKDFATQNGYKNLKLFLPYATIGALKDFKEIIEDLQSVIKTRAEKQQMRHHNAGMFTLLNSSGCGPNATTLENLEKLRKLVNTEINKKEPPSASESCRCCVM